MLLCSKKHSINNHLQWCDHVTFHQLKMLWYWKSLFTEGKASFFIFYISFYHITKPSYFRQLLCFLDDKFFKNWQVEIFQDTISTSKRIICVLPCLKWKSIYSIYYWNQFPSDSLNLLAVNITFCADNSIVAWG